VRAKDFVVLAVCRRVGLLHREAAKLHRYFVSAPSSCDQGFHSKYR
jgi:hypothetical protein